MTTTRAEQKANRTVEHLAQQIGMSVLNFERRIEQMSDAGVTVRGMAVRLPTEEKPDYLITVRADGENAAMVAFSGGLTLAEVLRGTIERMGNGSLKWREDEYR